MKLKQKIKFFISIIIQILLLTSFSVSFSALAEDNVNTNNITNTNTANTNDNAVNKATQSKSLPYFDKIVAVGIGNLYIKQGKEQNLSVKTDAALLPLISATVEDKTLFLDFKGAAEHQRAEINYYLTIKNVNSIKSLTSSTIFIEEGIETEELNLEIMSFGEMNVKLDTKQLTAKIQGAGKIKAHGKSSIQNITIIGAGEFLGADLKGEDVEVNIEGTGVATVNASKTLKIVIPKEGSVRYCGMPTITKEVSEKAQVGVSPENLCQ